MGHRRFIVVLLAGCLAGYASLIFFGSTDEYCNRSKSFADLSPCYKFEVQGQRADVLLVGDSSLLYAIRPELIVQKTGKSAYNYGLVGPVFAFNPQGVIDRYLRSNRKPRAIIVYVSPWDIVEPGRINDRMWFPIGLTALRKPDVVPLSNLIRARPAALVEIAPIVASSTGLRPGNLSALRHQMERARGFFDYSAQLSAEQRHIGRCVPAKDRPTFRRASRSRAAFNELKSRYSKQGVAVYVYVAPIAACGAPTNAVRAYEGIADNELTILPDHLFADDNPNGEHVHVNAEGSAAASDLLASFIATRGIASR